LTVAPIAGIAVFRILTVQKEMGEEMEEEEVDIVLPHADLVTLIRIRLRADFERAATLIATLMTNHAE
jgi:hypothetical protein